MREQEQICENFINIIKNEDIHKYAGDAIWDFVQALFTGDVFSGLSSIKNIRDMIFHAPTVIFWNKMQKFLLGTYRNFNEQIKMASEFSKDNEKYKDFVVQMIETVDKLDNEIKIDYYSNITRSFLLELIDEDLFYKLRQILMSSTISELDFIKNHKDGDRFDYNIMIFALKNCGLVDQVTDDKTYYIFTDLAKRLKEHALSGDEEPKHKTSYTELMPPEDLTPVSDSAIEEMFNNNTNSLNATL